MCHTSRKQLQASARIGTTCSLSINQRFICCQPVRMHAPEMPACHAGGAGEGHPHLRPSSQRGKSLARRSGSQGKASRRGAAPTRCRRLKRSPPCSWRSLGRPSRRGRSRLRPRRLGMRWGRAFAGDRAVMQANQADKQLQPQDRGACQEQPTRTRCMNSTRCTAAGAALRIRELAALAGAAATAHRRCRCQSGRSQRRRRCRTGPGTCRNCRCSRCRRPRCYTSLAGRRRLCRRRRCKGGAPG